MRLDKYLSNSGVGTRSQVKRLIKDKRIKVNDVIVKSDSFNVNENTDKVYFDDTLVRYKKYFYILLNKPKGYVCANIDNVYPTVLELLKEYDFVDLFTVGRLDVDTTGALLITNDGDTCHALLAPKRHVDKTYSVTVDKKLDPKLIEAFKTGIMLDGELTLPGDLVILDDRHAELTLHQGKFHQVKRMFKHFGYEVVDLDRKFFAFLDVGDLKLGEYRELSLEEENRLLQLAK